MKFDALKQVDGELVEVMEDAHAHTHPFDLRTVGQTSNLHASNCFNVDTALLHKCKDALLLVEGKRGRSCRVFESEVEHGHAARTGCLLIPDQLSNKHDTSERNGMIVNIIVLDMNLTELQASQVEQRVVPPCLVVVSNCSFFRTAIWELSEYHLDGAIPYNI